MATNKKQKNNYETHYFHFGTTDRHNINGQVFDANTVVSITAKYPREQMTRLFGNKWAYQTRECPVQRTAPFALLDLNELGLIPEEL